MRIGYVCLDPGIPFFGTKGASNHIREFVAALEKLGHDVRVFASRVGESNGHEPFSVERVPLPARDVPTDLAKEIRCLDQNEILRQTLAEADRREPFDLLYERYSLWSYAALQFAETRGLPFVLEVNSPLRVEQKTYRDLHLESAAQAVEQLVFRSAGLVAGVSQNVVDHVLRCCRRTLPTIVVPNGVDLDLFKDLEPKPRGSDFTVGFVGSLKPWHGIENLLEAFRELAREDQGYRLLLVGEGPLREWVHDFSRQYNLGSVIEVTGGVPKRDIPSLLSRMDVAVAPYPDLDDFYFSPLKIFEYMAAGRAIVASRIGQIGALLADGQTALLVNPGNTEELAQTVRLLRANPELQLTLGRKARQEAFTRHGWERRVETVLNCLPADPGASPYLGTTTQCLNQVPA